MHRKIQRLRGRVVGITFGVLVCAAVPTPLEAACYYQQYCHRECYRGPYGVECQNVCETYCVPYTQEETVSYGHRDDGKLFFAVILALGLIFWAIAAGSSDEGSSSEETEPDPPPLAIEDNLDIGKLLAELEAQAPQHLSAMEKVEWAAREAAKRIAERG